LHYHPIPNGAKQKEKAGNRPKHRPRAATRFYQAASANPRPVGFTPEMFGAPAATADAIFPAVGADEPPLHLGAWSVAPDDSPNLRGPSGLLGEVGSGVEHSAGLTRAITNIIEGRSA